MTHKETELAAPSERDEIIEQLNFAGFSCASYLTSGATADIYTAIEKSEGRLVAVKVLAAGLRNSERARAQFVSTGQRQEALAEGTSSGSLVPVLQIGQVRSAPYLVMPYAGGGTLRDRLQANPDRRIDDRIRFAEHVVTVLVKAVEPLHQAGFVHRDIKPPNLLLFSSGSTSSTCSEDAASTPFMAGDEVVRLGDFGLATSYKNLSYSGRLPAGTLGFAAPETLSANPDWTPQADLFSATMCIVEILLGEPPGPDWADQLSTRGYNRKVRAALAEGAHTSPNRRPASVEQWGEKLRSGLRARPSTRKRSALVVGLAAVGLGAATLVAVDGNRSADEALPPLGAAESSDEASAKAVDSEESPDEAASPVDSSDEAVNPEELPNAVVSPEGEIAPLEGPTFSCSFDIDQLPTAALVFADVGPGGAVPGNGDCERLNLSSVPVNVDSEVPWNDMKFRECQTLLVDEGHATGDYTVFIKPAGQAEVEVRRSQRVRFATPVTIESIRVEASTSMAEGPQNYLGLCDNTDKREDVVTQLDFHLDVSGKTQPEPSRYPAS